MPWIDKHRRDWRAVVLAMMLIAVAGPWSLDLISVPAEHTCSSPYIRLEGDFCGLPVSGMPLFILAIPRLVNVSIELVSGATTFADWVRTLLVSLCVCLLLLPWPSTLLLVLRGHRRCRQVFTVVAWGLASGIGLLVVGLSSFARGLSSYPRLFWALWGIWLYVVLAVSALTLEALTLAAERRSGG